MLSARTRNAPALRLFTPEHIAHALRRHFARHNLRVSLLAVGTLLAAVALWLILYAVCCWLILLALTVVDVPQPRIPRGFSILFGVAALCAVIYAWIDRRLTPNDMPRDDREPGEIVADFILAIPRVTLTVGGTLAAWQRLTDAELFQAAALLHRLAEEPRVPMSGVPLEIPDSAARLKILFALQLTQVIDIGRRDGDWWVTLDPRRPQSLQPPSAAHQP